MFPPIHPCFLWGWTIIVFIIAWNEDDSSQLVRNGLLKSPRWTRNSCLDPLGSVLRLDCNSSVVSLVFVLELVMVRLLEFVMVRLLELAK
eukprot:2568366-Ditylum_brightwellii.AAC.1